MAAITPRRSSRISHVHTPKMTERKKALFQEEPAQPRESLTQHRRLSVVESESDSDDCDLGIMGTLDSSSSDENDHNTQTPERAIWHETRSQTKKLLKENHELKNFIKSPFTLNKYQTRHSCPESRCIGSMSTPVTPHMHNHPHTPSSTHSCASGHTTSSTSSRARKSLASLIADTESCSSSLKDLNFDTDSSSDSKENTPTKSINMFSRKQRATPKLQSFKGILHEQLKNSPTLKGSSPNKNAFSSPTRTPMVALTKMDLNCIRSLSPKYTNLQTTTENTSTPHSLKFSPTKGILSPMRKAVVCLTKMDINNYISPTQMLKTPQNVTEVITTPPKLGHNRHVPIEIQESPESTCDSEKSQKRLRHDSFTDSGPIPKYPKLDFSAPPKARTSLFNSDRFKEILSTKSFYGKSNPQLNLSVTKKINKAIEVAATHHRRSLPHSHSHRRKRQPGQINLGVRHKIRKPKINKNNLIITRKERPIDKSPNNDLLRSADVSNMSINNTTVSSQNTTQELDVDKHDPFNNEKVTIDALLSQWTEEEVPESELSTTQAPRPELPCFNKTVIEETGQILQPSVTAVPVSIQHMPQYSEAVIIELGANNVGMAQSTTKQKRDDIIDEQSNDMSLVPQDVIMMEACHSSDHGNMPKGGQFLPVEGGFIVVEDNAMPDQEDLPDIDAIEREMRMLDEQIMKTAHSNNMNAEAVLASTETITIVATDVENELVQIEKPQKLFSIFNKPTPTTPTTNSKDESDKSNKKSLIKTGINQYIIDAGQKKIGATQCVECGVIYQLGDYQDEHDHLVHHNATDILRFNGWKEECVVEKWDTARCIRVRGGESGWKKVQTLLERVIHPHLGYGATLPKSNLQGYTAYLYIEKKLIIGCLVVEPKMKAYKLLPGNPDCCSIEDYPVRCGISRLWTHINHRRKGIASRMLNCARVSYLYGTVLKTTDLAFSAPTVSGKALATEYCGTPNFYVYLD